MKPRICVIATWSLFMGLAPTAAGQPARVLRDAAALWHMKDESNAVGANGKLDPIGENVSFGTKLEGEARKASLERGGDGYAATLAGGALSVAPETNGEPDAKGRAATILLRLKNTGADWNVTLFSKRGGHDIIQYDLSCSEKPNGAIALGFEIGTTEGLFESPAAIRRGRLNGWHDIVGRMDAGSADLFLDGELCDSVHLTGRLRADNDLPLILGGRSDEAGVSRRFTGLIDHAAIWNRALSTDEIAALSGRPVMRAYAEPYRPQVHFSPRRNWTNDPNGLVFHNGKYHLFYQYNPFGTRWGHMSWGHAVSNDLMHWKHLPIAIPEQDHVMIFSGSAVYDKDNTSGFGRAGEGPLVAIYSGHDTRRPHQTQNLAYSTDDGLTWTKYKGNPVIDIGAENFRDPKVFWHEADKRWIMVVALADQFKARFYASPNLKQWTHLSDFGPAGVANVPNWECPDLFELPVEGEAPATRWILQIDVGEHAPAGGSGSQYFVGRFDGKKFENENAPDTVLWVDHGSDFYAAQSYSGLPASGGRRIWLAWMNNWRYADAIPTYPWRGCMIVPREVHLTRTQEGIRLRQQPVREIENLRGKAAELRNEKVSKADDPLDELDVRGRTFDIVAEFEPGSARRFGLRVCEDSESDVTIGYDARLREMFVDRRKSGRVAFHDAFAGFHAAPLAADNKGRIRLRIIVDRSSVEVFGNEGLAVITDRIFPQPSQTGVSLFAEGGTARIVSIEIYPLQSVW